MVRNAIPARRCLSLALGACLCVLTAGCGSRPSLPSVSKEAIEAEAQRQVAFRLERLIEETRRLQAVAFPILTANADYCGDAVGPGFGLSALSRDALHPDLRSAAAQYLFPDGMVTVVHVVKDSPARRAGLAPGDRILAVGRRSVPDGREGAKLVARTLAEARPGQALPVTVLRGGRELTFAMRPVRSCRHPVLLGGQGGEILFTDGGRIVIGRGALRLAASDDELALLVSHELGHIVAGHMKARRTDPDQAFGGFRLDAPIGGAETEKTGLLSRVRGAGAPEPYSQPQESEADYLGLYFAARAGFDTGTAETFWRKLSDHTAQALPFSQIHPASPERFVLIAKTRDEIALKRRSGLPLVPNLRRR